MPILAYGILPWLVIVPVAATGLRDLWRNKPWLARIAAWFILPLLFFSGSSGKLATYILPVYPPFAILMAAGLMEAARRGVGRRLFKIGGMILGGAALVTMPAVWLVARPYYGPGEGWKWIAFVVALAFWAGASLLAMRSLTLRRGIRAYAAAPLVLFLAIHFLYPVTAEARPSLSAFVEQNRADIPPTAMVVADTEVVHGLCWLLQRDDLFLFPVGGELSYGLSREGEEDRLLDPQRLAEWVQDPARREDLVLILDDKKFTTLLAEHLDPLALQHEIRRESLGFLLLRYAPSSGAGDHEAGRTAGKEGKD
jgi:4-amino-4-deoxy-L-arabinose transferase